MRCLWLAANAPMFSLLVTRMVARQGSVSAARAVWSETAHVDHNTGLGPVPSHGGSRLLAILRSCDPDLRGGRHRTVQP